jgi:threonine dehydratase
MKVSLPIDRTEITAAASLIGPYIRHTPILHVRGQDLGVAADCTLKLEYHQYAGSFKTRGAFANLMTRRIPAAGVAAASGGNHGTAVAYAARTLGIRARIFVPAIASPAKIERIRGYGADLVVVGECYGDALEACTDWVASSRAMPVHAFDQRETVLGQATVAMELSQQDPALDSVLVSVGGGGLIGGIASWYQGAVRVIGVEPHDAPTMTAALAAGAPVDAPVGSIAADSLAPTRVGQLNLSIARVHVARMVLVSDDDIALAQRVLWEGLRIVAEPGGAAALAALVAGRYVPVAGERIGIVISGANTVINHAGQPR